MRRNSAATAIAVASLIARLATGQAEEAVPDATDMARQWLRDRELHVGLLKGGADVTCIVMGKAVPLETRDGRPGSGVPTALASARLEAAENLTQLLNLDGERDADVSRPESASQGSRLADGLRGEVAGLMTMKAFRTERRVAVVCAVTATSLRAASALRENVPFSAKARDTDAAEWAAALPLEDVASRFGAMPWSDRSGRGCVVAFGVAPARESDSAPHGLAAARESAFASLQQFAGESLYKEQLESSGGTLLDLADERSPGTVDNRYAKSIASIAGPLPGMKVTELRRWSLVDDVGDGLVGVVVCAYPGEAAKEAPPAIGFPDGGTSVCLREYVEFGDLGAERGLPEETRSLLYGRGISPGQGREGYVAAVALPDGTAPDPDGAHCRIRAMLEVAGVPDGLHATSNRSETLLRRVPGCIPVGSPVPGAAGSRVHWQPMLLPTRLVDALGFASEGWRLPDTSDWLPASNWARDASDQELAGLKGFRVAKDADGVPCLLAVGSAGIPATDAGVTEAAVETARRSARIRIAHAFGGVIDGQRAGKEDRAPWILAGLSLDVRLPPIQERRRWELVQSDGTRAVWVLMTCRLEQGVAKPGGDR